MQYTMIAGVNGVGKSTIYTALSCEEKAALGVRVNVDEVVSTLGHWSSDELQFIAAKQAVKQIKEHLESGITFHQETTLAGRSIASTIKKAKEKGYKILLWYVFVDSAETSKQRVAHRVQNGGHGIPDDVIENRFVASFENLKYIMPLCDEINLYNNTSEFEIVAKIIGGQLTIYNPNIPKHIMNVLRGD
ncbi:MAG: zeta toxin family protein [Defluviitaleaceae bacterium]|nr:zeta toxin family protein [Defluviitaleaceae bacterium]